MVLKNLLQAVVHRQRKEPAAHPSIYRLLLPSCMTIILSTAFFMAATWGWFTANQSAGVTTITAGSFQPVKATVTTTTLTITETYYVTVSAEGEPSGQPASGPNTTYGSEDDVKIFLPEHLNADHAWVFDASANRNHHFKVETEGNTKGYVQVTIKEDPAAGGRENCTLYGYVDDNGTLQFNLLLDTACTVTIQTFWGQPVNMEEKTEIDPNKPYYGHGEKEPVVKTVTVELPPENFLVEPINTENTNTEPTNTENTNTENSNTENSNTENTNTENSNTENSNTENSNTENSNTENSNTENSNTENSNTESNTTENTATSESSAVVETPTPEPDVTGSTLSEASEPTGSLETSGSSEPTAE